MDYDSRTGDESPAVSMVDLSPQPTLQAEPDPSASAKPDMDPGTSGTDQKPSKPPSTFQLPDQLKWIPANWSWPKLKPVLRSALSAWICVLLIVINPSMRLLGQVSSWRLELLLSVVLMLNSLLGEIASVISHRRCRSQLDRRLALSLSSVSRRVCDGMHSVNAHVLATQCPSSRHQVIRLLPTRKEA